MEDFNEMIWLLWKRWRRRFDHF